MCESFPDNIKNYRKVRGILFSDEANFYINGEMSTKNLKYLSEDNPHWASGGKQQETQKN
jgi:hypothetical protein